MRRIHAFELEDQSWFPAVLRDAGMAYLRFAADTLGQAEAMRPIIERALDRSGESELLDLGSGGGGPAVSIARRLRRHGRDVRATMTDLYPSPSAQERLSASDREFIRYEASPVDATRVPASWPGLRTIFNAFHHFRPELATLVLKNAVDTGRPIAVVEGLRRRAIAAVAMLFAPVVTLLVVPFLRPFRASWLLFTYVVPLIPFLVWWDGTISVFRIYDEDELLVMAREADPEGTFSWSIEDVPIPPGGVPGIALIGIPKPPAG